MSDHEFNNYLTLLAGLLRLGDKQRRAIAEELRTHLEDRLEELLGHGVSREQAIQQALSEFGDAAGLAAQFASISRGRRRRWLMRAISFSAAAMLLMAAGLAIFWPGRNAGPGTATVAAQAPQEAGASQPAAEPAATRGEAADRRGLESAPGSGFQRKAAEGCRHELDRPDGSHVSPQRQDPERRGSQYRFAGYVSRPQLAAGHCTDLLLKELDLTYADREELILITTPDEAESELPIRIYDCRDLLGWPWPGNVRPAAGAGATLR